MSRGATRPRVLRAGGATTAIALATLALAGCGFRLGAPEPRASSAGAEVARAQLELEDTAWALRSNFLRADFGPEWRDLVEAGETSLIGLPTESCLAELGIDAAALTAAQGSARYTRANGAFNVSTALVYDSADHAQQAFGAMGAPRFTECMAAGSIDFLGRPATAVGSASTLAVPPRGDQSLTRRIEATYAVADGRAVPFVIDLVSVRVDRAIITLWFANPEQPPVDADRDAVVDALLMRLETLPEVAPEVVTS